MSLKKKQFQIGDYYEIIEDDKKSELIEFKKEMENKNKSMIN